jgi:chitodextrinase
VGKISRALAPLVLLLVIAALVEAPASGATRTLTFGPVADTLVRADKPTKGFGTLTTFTADNSPVEHALLRFTVSGVGTDVVTAATLRLFVKNASPMGGSVYRVASQTWSENVNWNNAPVADALPLATAGKAAVGTWMQFNVLPLIAGDGTYSVRIKSTSADGVDYASRENLTTTQRPQLVVTTSTPPDLTAPTVSITSPTEGATVSGSVSLAANANDANGVTSVSFFADGSLVGTDASAPYTATWDSTAVSNGPHSITATARDPAGNVGSATAVGVTVSNFHDTTAPTVSITAPTEGTTVSGQTQIEANASDDVGVTSVTFSVDGSTVGTDTTSPYSTSWDTTAATNGPHTVSATAVDAATNTGAATDVHVTVDNGTDGTPPTVPGNLAATATGATKVSLSWQASSDASGVSSYEIQRNGAVIDSVTSPGYLDTGLSPGTPYNYAVRAIDPLGNRSDPATASATTDPLQTSFTFAAAGDHGANGKTALSLAALDTSPAEFYLAVGDMDYDETPTDAAWCDYVHQHLPTKGPSFPFEVVTGNHEDDFGPNGDIRNFAACLPDKLNSTPEPGSQYGVNYSFDYPAEAPLARFIMISPNLTVGGVDYDFKPGTAHYTWLANTIDDAHADGIPWVIVGFHFPCLTAGNYSCGTGPALSNLLMQKHVDLVLHGHEHTYQRGKQLALDPVTCPSIAASGYNPGCVVDDGFDGVYPKGAGTVDVVAGTFGRPLYNVFRSDPEGPYFTKLDGTTHGFVQYTVTASQLTASFVPTDGGPFSDSFTIASGATASADRTPPSKPANVVADTSVPGRISLSWSPSTDDVALDSYAVFRDGTYVATTTAPTFTDPSVTSGQTYTYTVTAYDSAFNPSATSDPVTATAIAANTLTFAPEADASIYSGSPTANFGTSSRLETDNSPVKHFLIRFTVSGVGSQQVTSAKLRLACVDASPRGGDITLAASNDWAENTVTWNAAPAAGTTISSLGAVAAGNTYQFDLSSVIHGDGTYTFRVTTPNADGADFTSRDGAIGSRPQLVLTVAP